MTHAPRRSSDGYQPIQEPSALPIAPPTSVTAVREAVPKPDADTRRTLRIEASTGDLPKGCRVWPTGLGTLNVSFLDLSERDAAQVIRAVKAVLEGGD
jgi:hypothetical protein